MTKAEIFLGMGDLQAAEALLANPDLPAGLRAVCAVWQRRYAEAIEIFSRALANQTDGDQRDPTDVLTLGLSQQLAGDV